MHGKETRKKKSALPVPGLSIPCFAVAAFGHVLIRCAPHVYDAAAPRDMHMINYKRPRHFFTATVTATPALKKIHASINKTHTTLDVRRADEYPSRTSALPLSLGSTSSSPSSSVIIFPCSSYSSNRPLGLRTILPITPPNSAYCTATLSPLPTSCLEKPPSFHSFSTDRRPPRKKIR